MHRLRREWPNFVLTTLAEAVQQCFGTHTRTCLPQDLNQIADRSIPRNYIGFIYADGNRMGETIKTMGELFPDDGEAKQAYKAFSTIVDQATREAAVQAVLECGVTDSRASTRRLSHLVPVEFVLAGGDDLILIVPAHVALPVTARFLTLFQERTRHLQECWVTQGRLARCFAPAGLTTSAGVVLAHTSYPASQLLDLAGELMKLAKRKAAALARHNHYEGTLDFAVFHTSGSERIKQRRQEEYVYEDKARTLTIQRTERPYTAAELARLLTQIQALKDTAVPRGKLKALYPVLLQSVMQAQFEAQHIKERLQVTGALQIAAVHALVCALERFPFRARTDTTWSTPLSEIIELYDFVHPARVTTSGEVAHA